jgi:superfamily II DNA or RNA helicase
MRLIKRTPIERPDKTYNLHVSSENHNYVANGAVVKNCHTVKAEVLRNQLRTIFRNVPIRWGLTGTVPLPEHESIGIVAAIGPVIGELSSRELQDQGVLANLDIEVVQLQDPILGFPSYASELKWLTTNPARLGEIERFVRDCALSGNTLVLVDRIETGKILIEKNPDWVFISGKVKSQDRSNEYAEISTSNNKVIIATYGVASVGINIPRIFNVVLVEPGKSFVRVIQSIGRGIRKAEDKDYVKIYDICSTQKYSKKHLTQRKQFYRDQQFPFQIVKRKY